MLRKKYSYGQFTPARSLLNAADGFIIFDGAFFFKYLRKLLSCSRRKIFANKFI